MMGASKQYWRMGLCGRCFVVTLVTLTLMSSISVSGDCMLEDKRSNGDQTVECTLKILDFRRNSSDIMSVDVKNAVRLNIECSDVFYFESQLRSDHLGRMAHLQELSIKFCKIRHLPPRSFVGLDQLKRLAIHTHNADWTSLPLEPDYEALVGLGHLQVLDLTWNNIGSLPAKLFCPLDALKTLNLSHNAIRDLADLTLTREISIPEKNRSQETPAGGCRAPAALESLYLDHNGLVTATPGSLVSLVNLRDLDLGHNDLAVLVEETLVGLGQLETLSLAFNHLTALPPRIFRATPKLISLDLANNTLGTLDLEVFQGLSQLQVLNLSGNSLDENWIKPGIFSGLTSLVVLDLSSNHLSRLEGGLLQDLGSLQYLDLSRNQIHTVAQGSRVFVSQVNLHTLDLSYNNLESLEAQTLSGLAVLNSLSLDHNKLHSLHQTALRSNCCSVLEDVSLRHNFLTEIPKALHQMPTLKSLDLSSNVIGLLKRESLQGLPNLSALKLSHNEISRIGEGSFKEAASLRHLDLSANRFQKLDQKAFESLDGLRSLNLADNQIEDFNGLLATQTGLKWLNMSGNRIAWFDYAFIPPGLEWLDLHDNNVDSLGNYYGLRDKYRLRYLDARNNRITGIEVLSVLPSIEVMKVDNNFIVYVAPKAFLGTPNLTSVSLTGNGISNLAMESLLVSVGNGRELPEFSVSKNPFRCDCRLSWLRQLRHGINIWPEAFPAGKNRAKDVQQLPRVVDLDQATCTVVNQTAPAAGEMSEAHLLAGSYKYYNESLLKVPESGFLCTYEKHCLNLCMCCDFFACDCQMKCPSGCSCFHDTSWNVNVVRCQWGGKGVKASLIPMDVTILHVEATTGSTKSNHTVLEAGMFSGRTRLTELHLDHIRVTSIENQTFVGLGGNLRILNLAGNELKQLGGPEFEGLGASLTHLYLQDNQLVSIDPSTFRDLVRLEVLRLDGNLLIDFPVWELAMYNRRLSSLSLAANWWQCQCTFVRKFRAFVRAYADVVADADDIKCDLGPLLTTQRDDYGPDPEDFDDDDGDCMIRISDLGHELFSHQDAASPAWTTSGVVVPVAVALCLALILSVGLASFKMSTNLKVWLHARCGIRPFDGPCLSRSRRYVQDEDHPKGLLFDALVMYSTKDADLVTKDIFCQSLGSTESKDYKFCLVHRDLGGIYTSEAFKSALNSSAIQVVVLSQAFISTDWDQVRDTVLLNYLVVVLPDLQSAVFSHRLDADLDEDLRKFLKNAKSVIKWANTPAFWRKIRYHLPDPTLSSGTEVADNRRRDLPVGSKVSNHKVAGAELDVSGLWTYNSTIIESIAATPVVVTTSPTTASGPPPDVCNNGATLPDEGMFWSRMNLDHFPSPPVKKQPRQCLLTRSNGGLSAGGHDLHHPTGFRNHLCHHGHQHQRSKSSGYCSSNSSCNKDNDQPSHGQFQGQQVQFQGQPPSTRSCGTNVVVGGHHQRSVSALAPSTHCQASLGQDVQPRQPPSGPPTPPPKVNKKSSLNSSSSGPQQLFGGGLQPLGQLGTLEAPAQGPPTGSLIQQLAMASYNHNLVNSLQKQVQGQDILAQFHDQCIIKGQSQLRSRTSGDSGKTRPYLFAKHERSSSSTLATTTLTPKTPSNGPSPVKSKANEFIHARSSSQGMSSCKPGDPLTPLALRAEKAAMEMSVLKRTPQPERGANIRQGMPAALNNHFKSASNLNRSSGASPSVTSGSSHHSRSVSTPYEGFVL